MSVVGPNGKDVFSIACTTKENGKVYISTILVEALSEDEANGIFRRWAKLEGVGELEMLLLDLVLSRRIT